AGWQRWQCMVNVGEQGARIHANGPRTRTLADVKAMLWRIETAAADRVGPAGLVSDLLEMLVDLATERGCAADLPERRQPFRIELDRLGHGRPATVVLVAEDDVGFTIAARRGQLADHFLAKDDAETFVRKCSLRHEQARNHHNHSTEC